MPMKFAHKQFYLRKFKGKIFLLKIGGEVVSDKVILESILHDIRTLWQSGIRVILVHGGGKQADALAAQIGHTPVKVGGRRVTSKQDLEIAKMLYGGSLNLEILGLMKKLKMKGIRVSGLDGGLLDTKIRDKTKFDFGFVGDIVRVHPKVLYDLLDAGYMPIVSPLAADDCGVILNINADTIAATLARHMKVEKLILFTNTDGVCGADKKLISYLTASEARELIASGVAKEGMSVKLQNALLAIESGVKRVNIINGLSPHSLLVEVLTKHGIGTMVVADREKKVYLEE